MGGWDVKSCEIPEEKNIVQTPCLYCDLAILVHTQNRTGVRNY